MSKPTKSIIFNKFKIKNLICSTHFGKVYSGINVKNKEPVAMKFENRNSKYNLLESEAYYLLHLKGFGIPRLISFGKTGLFYILVEELLGLSIQSIWNNKKNNNKNFLLKDVCLIGIQCLDRLEYIHSKDVIHRDIKPMNITIGRKDPNVLYLIDFGFAHKFRSTRTGKHIQYKNIKKVLGSIRYLSINGNKGYEQSRRDDLESLGYMLIFLAKNTLPWMYIENLDIEKIKKYKSVFAYKKRITSENLCAGLPQEFCEFFNYVKKLEFEQDPDYKFMKKLFLDILEKNNFKNDTLFSWVKNNKKIKIENKQRSVDKKNNDCNSMNKKGRKDSIKRLYFKIKNSLGEKKNKSIDVNNTNKILGLDILEENKNIRNILNLMPIDKNIEKRLEKISPKKEISCNKTKPINIYKRKLIKNYKIFKKESESKDISSLSIIRNNINPNMISLNNDKINDNIKIKEKKDNVRKSMTDSEVPLQNKNAKDNNINIKYIHYKKNFLTSPKNYVFTNKINEINISQKNKESYFSNSFRNYKYKTLKERQNSENNIMSNHINKFLKLHEDGIIENNFNFNKIHKDRVSNQRSRNNINEFSINLKTNRKYNNIFRNEITQNNNINDYKSDIKSVLINKRNKIYLPSYSPINYDNGKNHARFHFKHTSFNNFDDNTFISNGQGLELNPNKKNIFLNDINSEYRYNSPNTKINRNNIINLKNINNHKRLKSSENNSFHKEGKTYMFNNYMENRNKNMNYIPLEFKRVGTNNFY